MMKKITRLALLAVAAAFLVAALPACSSGSSDDDDTTQGGGGGGGGNTGAPIDLTYSFKNFSNAAFSGTAAITLSSDVTLNTDTDGVKIVLLAAGSEAFGSEQIAADTESNGVTLTNKYKLKDPPPFIQGQQ